MRRIGLVVFALCVFAVPGFTTTSVPIITTVAGGGPDLVDLGTAFVAPTSLFLDGPESLLIVGQGRVFHVDPGGQVRVIAGSGGQFYSGDGVAATNAALYNPFGVTRDGIGNLYIADTYNHRIRRVDAVTGLIITVAGTGEATGALDGAGGNPADDLGDGRLATSATLRYPTSLAFSPAGDLVIADTSNHRIRKIAASTGIIVTIAGTGVGGGFEFPHQIVYEPSGDLLIADQGHSRVVRLSSGTGVISTVAGNGTPTGVFDGEGGNPADDLGDGGPAAGASLKYPSGIMLDGQGRLLIADTENHRIRRVDPASGIITTIVGTGHITGYIDGPGGDPADDLVDGTPATETTLRDPTSIVEDAEGNLIIADSNNFRVRRVAYASGLITSISGAPWTDIGDGGPATKAITLARAVAANPAGDFFIADYHRVRRVDAATGDINTVAGCIDPLDPSNCGFSNGSPGTQLQVLDPRGLAVHPGGDLLISVSSNYILRLDTTTGTVTFFAGDGSFGRQGDGGLARHAAVGSPGALALDDAGNVYIAQRSEAWRPFDSEVVRRVDAATGIISTVAGGGYGEDGGPAVDARLSNITGIAVDTSGNLYIAESYNHRIRRVDAATGIITSFAGTGEGGFAGDGGPAGLSLMSNPGALAIDSDGNLLIADVYNGRVRKIDLATEVISTVAGVGLFGNDGDGGPATDARLSSPSDIAALADGGFLIADPGVMRVRLVQSMQPPQPPVADAGEDFGVGCSSTDGTPVNLDGSGSSGRPGAVLAYAWTGSFPEGGGFVTGVQPTVTLPQGQSTITLVTSDGRLDSAPDTVEVSVALEPVGLQSPLAALAPEGQTPPLPAKTFKRGAVLPIRLRYCGQTQVVGGIALVPKIIGLSREGTPIPLPAKSPSKGSQPEDLLFRLTKSGDWLAKLKTKGMASGTHELTIEMPDGKRFVAGFVIR